MTVYQKAILDYEQYRQAVSQAESATKRLINECEKVASGESSEPCHAKAWVIYNSAENIFRSSDECHLECSYQEIIDNTGCEKCVLARKIKVTDLKDLRAGFGKAKRKLSFLGKKLTKENADE